MDSVDEGLLLLLVGGILAGSIRRRARCCAHGLPVLVGVPGARDAARLGRAGRDRVRRRGARARGRHRRARADPLRGRALQTSWRRLREVAVPAALLSTVGVVVSAAPDRRRRVRALRPLVARVGPARRRRRLDRRGGGLRDAPLHAHPAHARAHARGGVGRQRPDGDRAHARPDRLDRATGRLRHRRPRCCSSSSRSGSGCSSASRSARSRRWVFARLPHSIGAVRAGRVGRGGGARVRRRGRDRRQRLPRGLPRRPRGRQHAVALPAPARRVPRRARVRRAGRALHRARPARLPARPAGRRARGPRARARC